MVRKNYRQEHNLLASQKCEKYMQKFPRILTKICKIKYTNQQTHQGNDNDHNDHDNIKLRWHTENKLTIPVDINTRQNTQVCYHHDPEALKAHVTFCCNLQQHEK